MLGTRNLALVVFLCVSVALLLTFAFASLEDMRRILPDSLEPTRVIFLRSAADGFGSGANETGFAVIHLSDTGARHVAEGGASWLNAQPGGRLDPDWRPTPVPQDDFWMGHPESAVGAWPAPTVRAVLNRYGFDIDLPHEHKAAVDGALNAPGSFYSVGRGGLVAVVVPASHRAYVFYAG